MRSDAFHPARHSVQNWMKLLRVHHWVKNGLVFLPVLFSGQFFAPATLAHALAAFACFSLASSLVYLNNDLADLEDDRAHPTKKTRPLASGAISARAAQWAMALLGAAALAGCLAFGNGGSLLVLAIYLIANYGYSRGAKHIPIADIAILASGFVLRVLFGGLFCDIPVSLWLFLTILSFAMYFAFGKRRGELARYGSTARKSLEHYPPSFLEQNSGVYLTLGLVFYSLWSYEHVSAAATFVSASSVSLVVGVPLVMLICMRYSFVIDATASDGDPVGVLLGDRTLLALLTLWVLVIFLSLYVVV